jgi:hypothetical protein
LAVAKGILSQLLQQDDAILAYLYEKASRSGQTTLSTPTLAKEILEIALKNSPKLYIIIDGIDECAREERKELVAGLESLRDSLPKQDDSLRCLFVCQDDNAARQDFANMVALKMTESLTRLDVRRYAHTWGTMIGLKFELTNETQRLIEDMITHKAEGETCLHSLVFC